MKRVIRREPTADPVTPERRIMRCAFTGYRPQKMPFGFNEKDPRCIDFKQRLFDTIEMLIMQGFTHFLSGGALGMDMYAAEAVIELRETYPWIALEVVIPFVKQPEKWEEIHQKRYQRILDEADIITHTGLEYTKGAMLARNRYLVDHSDLLVAAYDGQTGGTKMTCEYAKKVGRALCIVRPVVDRVSA